jgi:hypothetical protein
MCYTKRASIIAFLTGILSSLALIQFGNEKYKTENVALGLFFIYVSFAQLIDYMLYIDPSCKIGSNQLAGWIGPILLALQPFILFVLYLFVVYKTEPSSIYNKYKNVYTGLNLLYLVLILFLYVQYIQSGDTCSKVQNGRVKWTWPEQNFGYYSSILYTLLLILNLTLFLQCSKYFYIAFGLVFLFYFISKFQFVHHVGEFWCFFSNSVPLIILILQKTIA